MFVEAQHLPVANVTFKTGLFITWANSKLEVLEDFSPFPSSIFFIIKLERQMAH
jgi:hypothetical protein